MIKYFSEAPKEEIEPLVMRLNEINHVKLCGGLGSCFNCRNKHIGMTTSADAGIKAGTDQRKSLSPTDEQADRRRR